LFNTRVLIETFGGNPTACGAVADLFGLRIKRRLGCNPVRSKSGDRRPDVSREKLRGQEDNVMATVNLNPSDLYFENMFDDATRIL